MDCSGAQFTVSKSCNTFIIQYRMPSQFSLSALTTKVGTDTMYFFFMWGTHTLIYETKIKATQYPRLLPHWHGYYTNYTSLSAKTKVLPRDQAPSPI